MGTIFANLILIEVPLIIMKVKPIQDIQLSEK